MKETRYLGIKNFDELQHYKDRNPIWIKVPCGYLEDYKFTGLPDGARYHVLALMLLAARLNNRLPYDAAWLSRHTNSLQEIDLEMLIEVGFLEILDDEDDRGGLQEKFIEVTSEAPPQASVQNEKKSASAISETVYAGEKTALEQNRTEKKRKEKNTPQQNKTKQNKTRHTTTEQNRRAGYRDDDSPPDDTDENSGAEESVVGGVVVVDDFSESVNNRSQPDPVGGDA